MSTQRFPAASIPSSGLSASSTSAGGSGKKDCEKTWGKDALSLPAQHRAVARGDDEAQTLGLRHHAPRPRRPGGDGHVGPLLHSHPPARGCGGGFWTTLSVWPHGFSLKASRLRPRITNYLKRPKMYYALPKAPAPAPRALACGVNSEARGREAEERSALAHCIGCGKRRSRHAPMPPLSAGD